MPKLTPKQEAFVQEYLIDLNATASAGRAGYKNFNIGRRLVTQSNVSEAIQKALQDRSKRTEITQDMVLSEYARIAFLDPAKLFSPEGNILSIHDMEEDTRRAISGMDVVSIGNMEVGVGEIQKIKIASKLGALDSLGKHLGMFIERKEVSGPDGGPVQIENMSDEDLLAQIRRG